MFAASCSLMRSVQLSRYNWARFGPSISEFVNPPLQDQPVPSMRQPESIIAPLGANIDRRPALGSGEDIRELQAGGVPVASLHQDGLDYFDIHHTADDTLDKIDPKQLDQAVAIWSAFTYLAAASDVDFRSLAATAK